MSKFRTDVENLLYEEMLDEDAKYLIMGDDDSCIDAIVPQNYGDGGVFDSTSSEEDIISDDDEIF